MTPLIHFYSTYEPRDPETQRRHTMAKRSWYVQGWKECPMYDVALTRMFTEPGKTLPYVGDLFDGACLALSDGDAVVYSNADIGFTVDAAPKIRAFLKSLAAGYSNRRNFKHRLVRPPKLKEMASGEPYTGTDTFFFRVSWWRQHRDEFPDMVIGRWLWDGVMRELMQRSLGVPSLELPNITWHETHDQDADHWYREELRFTLPGQIHNLRLALDWFKARGIDPETHDIHQT